MIADIDKDGSGTIDFDEFLQMMTAKMSEKDSREEILKAFRLFDDDETGKISFKNLKRVAKELGENMTDEELQVQAARACTAPETPRARRWRRRARRWAALLLPQVVWLLPRGARGARGARTEGAPSR
eukprot:1181287-Prymnesium_polylepis.1